MNGQTEKLLFKIPEVCERLSMSRSRVFAELASGRLESVKVGKVRLISAGQLARYVARLEGTNAGHAA